MASPVTLNVSSVSLKELVSHIIEDLEISDTEEEMINTVNGVEQEKIFQEGKKYFHCKKGIEYNLI